MKANNDKYHLLLSSPDDSRVIVKENSTIKCPEVKKIILGVHIDYKLKFDLHVETICKKAHRKLSAL